MHTTEWNSPGVNLLGAVLLIGNLWPFLVELWSPVPIIKALLNMTAVSQSLQSWLVKLSLQYRKKIKSQGRDKTHRFSAKAAPQHRTRPSESAAKHSHLNAAQHTHRQKTLNHLMWFNLRRKFKCGSESRFFAQQMWELAAGRQSVTRGEQRSGNVQESLNVSKTEPVRLLTVREKLRVRKNQYLRQQSCWGPTTRSQQRPV